MTEENRKQILTEAVQNFGKQEWFRDATIYDAHPNTGEPTLEIKVNYVPFLDRKNVKQFAAKYGLTDRFIVVDKGGKPVD